MKQLGLLGQSLKHSFSKKYFEDKFRNENIEGFRYDLFEISSIDEFPALLEKHPDLIGMNVTIPYKTQVIPYLHSLDESAEKVGAVNVIKIDQEHLTGYNSDYYGFFQSLHKFLDSHLPAGKKQQLKALILGTGGASKAVAAALADSSIMFEYVSRSEAKAGFTYADLNAQIISDHKLIINTTPAGMYPDTNTCPELPYEGLTSGHFLYDLVYNPENTLFMQKGAAANAKTKNGLAMLYLQAEKAWEIWNTPA